MIIVNGAGSAIAQKYIKSEISEPILAISRGTNISQGNVKNVFTNCLDELEECLKALKGQELVWVNFKATKTDAIISKVTVTELQDSFNTNFLPNFLAVKYLAPKMILNKKGSFIFIDSVKAGMGETGCLAYSSSKQSNNGLQKTTVKEFSRFGITCNTICLSYVNTPMWNKLSSSLQESLLTEVPGKKLVDTDEINATIRFLISNRIINGTKIILDGGLTNM
ncbi:MAG: SDR family NAD(P)-dependent oxidoreductase [Paracoccaceae bacterium]